MLLEETVKIRCIECNGTVNKLQYEYICEDCGRSITYPQKTEKKKTKRKVIFKTLMKDK